MSMKSSGILSYIKKGGKKGFGGGGLGEGVNIY